MSWVSSLKNIDANILYRRIITAPTTTQATTTAAATLSSATSPSAARSGSMRGTPAASITASWMNRGLQTSWANRRHRGPSSYPTRMPRVSPLASTSTSVTSGRFIRSVAGRSGFSCVRCSGTAGRGRWSLLIGRLGTLSCSRGVTGSEDGCDVVVVF